MDLSRTYVCVYYNYVIDIMSSKMCLNNGCDAVCRREKCSNCITIKFFEEIEKKTCIFQKPVLV